MTEGFGAGHVAAVDLTLADVDTNSGDYADFIAAVQTAVDGYSGAGILSFDGTTLRFEAISDGDTMDDLIIDLAITDDVLSEGPEDFRLELFNPSSSTNANISLDLAAAIVTTMINDTQGPGGILDGPVEWSISGPAMVDEGDSAIYLLELTGTYQAGEAISVDLALIDIDTNSLDYANFNAAIQTVANASPDVSFNAATGTLTYVAPIDGATLPPLSIDLTITSEATPEPTETFRIELSNASSTTGLIPTIPATADTVTTAIRGPLVAELDINNTIVNTPVSGTVLTNDYDPSANPFTVIGVNGVPIGGPIATPHGTVEMNPDGTYTYTPNTGYTGTDKFTYEICGAGGSCATATITFEIRDAIANPANTPPVATDDTASGFIDNQITGSLISNDGDPDGDVVSVNTTPISQPTNGSVVINPDGTFVYTPDPGFMGVDTFEYETCDAAGNCDIATVSLTVFEDTNGATNNVPAANDDVGIGQINEPVVGNLLANDSDPNGDPLTINTTPISGPTNGTLTINPDGSFEYVPNPDYSGNDSFVYEVCDDSGACEQATVYLTVFNNPPAAVNDFNNTVIDLPVSGNVLSNDSDPNVGDSIVVTRVNGQPVGGGPVRTDRGNVLMNADGTYTYEPLPGETGFDSFTYTIVDEAGIESQGTITVEIRDSETDPTQAPPIANDDQATAFVGQIVNGTLLTNDGDPTGQNITINTSPTRNPVNGTVLIRSNGTFSYVPYPNFVGTDTFSYQIVDEDGNTDTAVVTITIAADANGPANDAPIGGDDAGITTKNVPIDGNLLANDFDLNGDALQINVVPVTNTSNGTLRINPDGTFHYVPQVDFVGNDSFQYEVCDSGGLCDIVTVQLTVFNQPPQANDDSFVLTAIDVPISGNVFGNDVDPDGDELTGRVITRPQFGTLQWNSNGSFVYIPNPDFPGQDFFEYEVCDTSGVCRTAIVSITMPSKAGGFPPVFPIINPVVTPLLSNQIPAIFGPGQVYGGIPINTNADPLRLDSGLPVTGGYQANFTEDACQTTETIPCEPCSDNADVTEDAVIPGAEGEVEHTVPVSEEPTVCDDSFSDGTGTGEVVAGEVSSPICAPVGKPSFLRRLGMWLHR